MKILVTNDDGYTCEGIIKLDAALRRAGHEVLTVAPDSNRSGSSNSFTVTSRVAVKEYAKGFWICNGTPVDCVNAVISGGIAFKPDIVVSGINVGANLGTDINFSGTASAARQGSLLGLPSIAFSLCAETDFFWDEAARWSADNITRLLGLWERDVFINVNMPNLQKLEAGFKTGFPARRRYIEKMRPRDGADGWKTLVIEGFDVETEFAEGSDHHHVSENTISVCRVFLYPIAIEQVKRGTV
jgi:5'-nucleotidase